MNLSHALAEGLRALLIQKSVKPIIANGGEVCSLRALLIQKSVKQISQKEIEIYV